ncbi:MAG: hypothetical protein RLZZ164_454 [Actinomycetota bacterium]|jgi:hypothetical protein
MIKRIAALVGFVALLGTLVWFSPKFALESGSAPTGQSVSVSAADLQLVCPGGAILSGGTNGTTVGSFTRLGRASVGGYAAGSYSVQSLSVDGSTSVADTTGPASLGFAASNSASVQVTSQQQGSTGLTATQLQNAANSRLNGLLGASCQAPSTDLWLVGGDTSTGRETLVLLSNPSSVTATVSLEAFGLGGAKSTSSGISVPAHGSQVVPLASILPETKSLAIHLRSFGSAIAAWMQQRTLRGLQYAGADWVAPVAEFNKQLSIPGLLIRGSKDGVALKNANADYFDLVPSLRIFNPSTQSVKFTAQIFGADAKTFGTVISDTVLPNSAADFDLAGLADGDYVAFVQADAPVAAAIRLPRTDKAKTPNTDFAWLPAVSPLSADQLISVPKAGISKLAIANPGKTAIDISVGATAVHVAPNSTVVLLAPAGGNLKISAGSAAFAATLITDVNGGVAAMPLVSYQNSSNQLTVLVR